MIVVVSFIDQFAQIDAQHKIAPFTTPLQQINAARQIAAIGNFMHTQKKIVILLLGHTQEKNRYFTTSCNKKNHYFTTSARVGKKIVILLLVHAQEKKSLFYYLGAKRAFLNLLEKCEVLRFLITSYCKQCYDF